MDHSTPDAAVGCSTPLENELFTLTNGSAPSTQTVSVPSDVDEDGTAQTTEHPVFARSALRGIVLCTTYSELHGKEIIQRAHTTREEAESILPTFKHLQAHLRSSVNILKKYSAEEFAVPHLVPPFTEGMAIDQITFMHHHSAVSETLMADMFHTEQSSFGLPSNYSWRTGRNAFCHSMLKPDGGILWADAAIEDTLADEEAWSIPTVLASLSTRSKEKLLQYQLENGEDSSDSESGSSETDEWQSYVPTPEAVAAQEAAGKEWADSQEWHEAKHQFPNREDMEFYGYEDDEDEEWWDDTRRHSI
ncbi:hypothetical protein E8E13_005752 [Curvularia kusanoi]|uniref:Uncharacterized protein n=1 Tax=Curvularia kusanoi TaxID=90978 RepID=A0A9P4TJ26_CURKU|nr:hypothetical protein E8E13_005752 [Curvularia kusanoi]